MTAISFTVSHHFDAAPRRVWDEMVDWPAHSAWIPATRVEVHDIPSDVAGATFTGYTGYGPLTLVDRMRISEITWDDAASYGTCRVEKLGPVLTGAAGFTIAADGQGCRVDWFEDVDVRLVPKLAAPIVNRLSAAGFSLGMRRLAKVIAAKANVVSS